MAQGMSADLLKALLDHEIKNSLGYSGGQMAFDRKKALDYYYG
jgi:hypothetical protein